MGYSLVPVLNKFFNILTVTWTLTENSTEMCSKSVEVKINYAEKGSEYTEWAVNSWHKWHKMKIKNDNIALLAP